MTTDTLDKLSHTTYTRGRRRILRKMISFLIVLMGVCAAISDLKKEAGDHTTTLSKQIWTFANGVKVDRTHITADQLERYKMHNLHEPDESELFVDIINSVPKNGIFVDVGGAIGYYVILAAILRPDIHVHTFNPNALMASRLGANLELNGVSGVVQHPEAVSKEINHFFSIGPAFGSGITQGMKTAAEVGVASSDTSISRSVTLEYMLQMLGRDHIDLMMMDIQGEELPVLRAAEEAKLLSKGKIKQFMIGTHLDVHEECERILRSAGFRITHSEGKNPPMRPDGMLIAKHDLSTPTKKKNNS